MKGENINIFPWRKEFQNFRRHKAIPVHRQIQTISTEIYNNENRKKIANYPCVLPKALVVLKLHDNNYNVCRNNKNFVRQPGA